MVTSRKTTPSAPHAGRHEPYRTTGSTLPFRFVLLTLLLGILLLSSCTPSLDWVQFRGTYGQGATSRSIDPPLGIKWKLRLQLDGLTLHAFNPPIVKGDTIYFGSADGNFYALDIESGYMRWVFKSGASINSVPYADEHRVYFGSQDGKAYAVDREEGVEVWNFDTGRPVNSTLQRYKDMVLFTSDGGASFFVDLQGNLVDKIPNPVWYFHTYQMVDDVMFFAPGPLNQPHSFGPYDTRSKKYLWIIDTDEFNAIWYSFPAVTKDRVFFSTCGYTEFGWLLGFHAYDRESGERIWSYEDLSRWGPTYRPDLEELFLRNLNLLDFMAPSVWKNLVIYTGGDAVVRAFDVRNGTLVWEKEFQSPVSSAPLVAGDRLYFGLLGDPHAPDPEERSPSLVCLSARDGRFLWRMQLEGALLSAPVAAGKWLMFGTDKSLFYILEEVF
ncbi:MAG: hypothetical protein Kow009_06870 [Spirochaetales bacterium]